MIDRWHLLPLTRQAQRLGIAIVLGWMPCLDASSASVSPPLIASSATLALNSAVYLSRAVFIPSVLNVRIA